MLFCLLLIVTIFGLVNSIPMNSGNYNQQTEPKYEYHRRPIGHDLVNQYHMQSMQCSVPLMSQYPYSAQCSNGDMQTVYMFEYYSDAVVAYGYPVRTYQGIMTPILYIAKYNTGNYPLHPHQSSRHYNYRDTSRPFKAKKPVDDAISISKSSSTQADSDLTVDDSEQVEDPILIVPDNADLVKEAPEEDVIILDVIPKTPYQQMSSISKPRTEEELIAKFENALQRKEEHELRMKERRKKLSEHLDSEFPRERIADIGFKKVSQEPSIDKSALSDEPQQEKEDKKSKKTSQTVSRKDLLKEKKKRELEERQRKLHEQAMERNRKREEQLQLERDEFHRRAVQLSIEEEERRKQVADVPKVEDVIAEVNLSPSPPLPIEASPSTNENDEETEAVVDEIVKEERYWLPEMFDALKQYELEKSGPILSPEMQNIVLKELDRTEDVSKLVKDDLTEDTNQVLYVFNRAVIAMYLYKPMIDEMLIIMAAEQKTLADVFEKIREKQPVLSKKKKEKSIIFVDEWQFYVDQKLIRNYIRPKMQAARKHIESLHEYSELFINMLEPIQRMADELFKSDPFSESFVNLVSNAHVVATGMVNFVQVFELLESYNLIGPSY